MTADEMLAHVLWEKELLDKGQCPACHRPGATTFLRAEDEMIVCPACEKWAYRDLQTKRLIYARRYTLAIRELDERANAVRAAITEPASQAGMTRQRSREQEED